MKPVVDGLEERYAGEFAVVRVNAGISAGKALAREQGCIGTPAYVLFDKSGNQARRFQGAQTSELFEQEINRILAE